MDVIIEFCAHNIVTAWTMKKCNLYTTCTMILSSDTIHHAVIHTLLCIIIIILTCIVERELVDKQPSPHTCLLLGDAYMAIQEVSHCIKLSLSNISEYF